MKVSGIYTIPYDNDMSVLNLENVYVDINVEDEAAEITLPKISEMFQRNVKFYMNLDPYFEQNFNAKIIAGDGDTINGLPEIEIEAETKGFWVLVQDTETWCMSSSNFLPISVPALKATINYVPYSSEMSVNIVGGVEPYEITWSLPQSELSGYEIDGAADEETVTLVQRSDADPDFPSIIAPTTGPAGIYPQLVKVAVSDANRNYSTDFYMLMTPFYN
jgi:hypothetical protein